MQIAGVGVDIEQARSDLAGLGHGLHVVHGAAPVGGIMVRPQLAQLHHRAIGLRQVDDLARAGLGHHFLGQVDEVDPAHCLVVLAHMVVAARAAFVVVEGHAGADHIDEGGPPMADRTLDERHELGLVARKAAPHIGGTQLQGQPHQIHGRIAVDGALLAAAALVGGGRELALGEAIHAVVFDDIDHAHPASHGMRKLTQTD